MMLILDRNCSRWNQGKIGSSGDKGDDEGDNGTYNGDYSGWIMVELILYASSVVLGLGLHLLDQNILCKYF